MSATYDILLGTDKDWVRFLIGDTRTTAFQLSDEEIAATLVEEPNKYLAAARCLESMYTAWLAAGKGVVDKKVDGLSIRRMGETASADDIIKNRIDDLRQRGAQLTIQQPTMFRVL
jgi:hypothetical protein